MPTMGMKNAVAAETADALVLTARNQWASDMEAAPTDLGRYLGFRV